MELENIIWNWVTQTQKGKHCLFLLLQTPSTKPSDVSTKPVATTENGSKTGLLLGERFGEL